MEAFEVFLQMTTQWNLGGMGSPVGLIYASLESVMRIFQITDVKDCFLKIRILESKTLELLRKDSENGSTTQV